MNWKYILFKFGLLPHVGTLQKYFYSGKFYGLNDLLKLTTFTLETKVMKKIAIFGELFEQ